MASTAEAAGDGIEAMEVEDADGQDADATPRPEGTRAIALTRGTAIRVTPLYGVQGEDPLCYLLEVDGCNILLDCGWNDAMDVELLAPLAAIAPSIDAVLVSHPDTAHLGALPYAFGTLGLNCKVYATLPVHKMGLMYMYDQYLARHADDDFDVFTLDHVDQAFSAFVPVRYVQHSALTGRGEGITVTPYAAGHMLGGAVWKVQKETEDVVYAVDYNHRKEKHLNGTALESINRPSLLITDAFNAQGLAPAKTRDADMLDAILRSVRQDGNVLIPIDPAGRVLELLLQLEEKWVQKQLGAYQLVLLTTVAYNTLEFARSHLEWMGENVGRNFDRDRQNAFNTRYLTLCHSLDELRALRPGPKVVMASFGSLEAGPARHLFTEWASDPRNLVVLTDRTAPGSLSREVRDQSMKPPGARQPLKVSVSRRVLLDGEELRAWKEERAAEKAAEAERAAAEKASAEAAAAEAAEAEHAAAEERAALEAMEVDDPDGDTTAAKEAAADSLLGIAQVTGAGTRAAELRRRRCLVDGFTPPEGAVAPMFDDELWEPDMTDFGEAINTEAFARRMTEASAAAKTSVDAPIAAPEGAAAAAAAATASSRAVEPSIPPPAPPPPPEKPPMKIVTEVRDVYLRAAVHACDYEGRADGRSVRTLVAHVEPRRVVLVHGTPEDTSFLADRLRTALPGVSVDAPAAGEAVDCTSDTAMYRLQLSQELLTRTRLRDVAGYQVGWVDGIVGMVQDGEGNERPVLLAPTSLPAALDSASSPGAANEDAAAVAVAEAAAVSRSGGASGDDDEGGVETAVTAAAAAVAIAAEASKERRGSAFVGDLKLSDLKLALAAAGMAAEFSGGALVCSGGSVCVRKAADGPGVENLVVEGALSDDFYRVRQILYGKYQIT